MKVSYKITLPIFIVLSALFSCKKKSVDMQEVFKDLAKQANIQSPITILTNKKFDVVPSLNLENIAIYTAGDDLLTHIATADTTTSDAESFSFKTVRAVNLGKNNKFEKMLFLNTGLEYSHILIITKPTTPIKNQKNEDIFLRIFILDYKNFLQEIQLNEQEGKTVAMKQIHPKLQEEGLIINNELYRFDSFIYNKAIEADKPLLFLETFLAKEENSIIIMKNRGGFTSGSYITFSFPDISEKEQSEIIRLTKDIPTVKLYKIGQMIYKYNRERIPAQHLTLEITKTPFSKELPIRLPLFITSKKDKIGKVLVRAAFHYRSINAHWPEEDQEVGPIEKDQQGYKAYIYNANLQ